MFFVELLLFESLAETWRKTLHCISWPVQEMSGDLRMHLFIFQLKTPWKCWTNTDPSLAPLLHYSKCSVKWTHSFLQFTQSLAAPELLPSTLRQATYGRCCHKLLTLRSFSLWQPIHLNVIIMNVLDITKCLQNCFTAITFSKHIGGLHGLQKIVTSNCCLSHNKVI